MTYQECPICSRIMCDHTEAERGGSFEQEIPKIPTVGNIYDAQKGLCICCEQTLPKYHEAVPLIVGDEVKLCCCFCFHENKAEGGWHTND